MVAQTAGRDTLGEFAPKFAQLNDDVLFGEVWSREDALSLKLRSIITVTALVSKGMVDSSFEYHLKSAKANGVTCRNGRAPHPRGVLRRVAQRVGGVSHGGERVPPRTTRAKRAPARRRMLPSSRCSAWARRTTGSRGTSRALRISMR